MNITQTEHSKAYIAFQVFKYSIYLLLCINVYVFFQQDYLASSETFVNGVELKDLVLAFTASIDTFSWVVLLLVFELETYILEDEDIRGITKWSMNIFKSLCYAFIVYSAYGYISKLLVLLDYSPFVVENVCSLINSDYTYIAFLDDYLPITDDVCLLLNEQKLYQITNTQIITTLPVLEEAHRMAWVDIVNASNWLLIVAVLEIDVYLQLKGRFTGLPYKLSKIVKPILYGILFICAVIWGIDGEFIDFWDAFLWLLAFFFIEMNIFEWHSETENINVEV